MGGVTDSPTGSRCFARSPPICLTNNPISGFDEQTRGSEEHRSRPFSRLSRRESVASAMARGRRGRWAASARRCRVSSGRTNRASLTARSRCRRPATATWGSTIGPQTSTLVQSYDRRPRASAWRPRLGRNARQPRPASTS